MHGRARHQIDQMVAEQRETETEVGGCRSNATALGSMDRERKMVGNEHIRAREGLTDSIVDISFAGLFLVGFSLISSFSLLAAGTNTINTGRTCCTFRCMEY